MEYTPPVLDLSTKRSADLTAVEPRFATLEPEAYNPSALPNCSDSNDSSASTSTSPKYGRSLKLPRPFKAYPKDPLAVTVSVATADTILGQDSGEAYAEFRKKMLSQVQTVSAATNKNMRRYSQMCCVTNTDPGYWEKRRKNNEAAKRSRDARRAKEDEIAIRCAFLEQENLKLKYESATLRDELDRLRRLIYKQN